MWRLFLIVSAITAVTWTAATAGVVLQSHRAVYELSLLKSRQGSGIGDLTGRLVMEWGSDCQGYILNQRMLTEVTDLRGGRALNDFQVTSWESVDGLVFRFSSRDAIDGKVTDEVVGKAKLSAAGAAGTVQFQKPRKVEAPLPAGTVFPSEQALLLLQAAERGEKTSDMLLFDGSRLESLYDTYGVIGNEYPVMSADEAGANALLAGQRSWPVHIAYFARKPEEGQTPGTPSFQVGYRLFQNGIASELLLDYGEFSLSGALSKLEPLPHPSC